MNAPAPELEVSQWFGTSEPIRLDQLRGRVVMIEAFQMLCPGCVSHGLPLARSVHEAPGDDVVVLGLHTVFEHHQAMSAEALEVFLYEYRIPFPVGVDRHDGPSPIPETMRRYDLRGTPSTVLIGKDGTLRWSGFGQIDAFAFGMAVGKLASEPYTKDAADGSSCDDDGCRITIGDTR